MRQKNAVFPGNTGTGEVDGEQALMTLALYEEIWTDPSDDYKICVVRYPDSLETEEGGCLMRCSYHRGKLWTRFRARASAVNAPRMVPYRAAGEDTRRIPGVIACPRLRLRFALLARSP